MQGEEQDLWAQGCLPGSCQQEGLGTLEQEGWMQRDVLRDTWEGGKQTWQPVCWLLAPPPGQPAGEGTFSVLTCTPAYPG